MSKPRCRYWDTCYRVNAQHKLDFLHPADLNDDTGDTQKNTKSSGKKASKTSNELKDSSSSLPKISSDADRASLCWRAFFGDPSVRLANQPNGQPTPLKCFALSVIGYEEARGVQFIFAQNSAQVGEVMIQNYDLFMEDMGWMFRGERGMDVVEDFGISAEDYDDLDGSHLELFQAKGGEWVFNTMATSADIEAEGHYVSLAPVTPNNFRSVHQIQSRYEHRLRVEAMLLRHLASSSSSSSSLSSSSSSLHTNSSSSSSLHSNSSSSSSTKFASSAVLSQALTTPILCLILSFLDHRFRFAHDISRISGMGDGPKLFDVVKSAGIHQCEHNFLLYKTPADCKRAMTTSLWNGMGRSIFHFMHTNLPDARTDSKAFWKTLEGEFLFSAAQIVKDSFKKDKDKDKDKDKGKDKDKDKDKTKGKANKNDTGNEKATKVSDEKTPTSQSSPPIPTAKELATVSFESSKLSTLEIAYRHTLMQTLYEQHHKDLPLKGYYLKGEHKSVTFLTIDGTKVFAHIHPSLSFSSPSTSNSSQTADYTSYLHAFRTQPTQTTNSSNTSNTTENPSPARKLTQADRKRQKASQTTP